METARRRVDNGRMTPAARDSRFLPLLGRALDLFLLGLLVLFLAGFVARNVHHAYDLRTYHAAARAVTLGRDPYDPGVLAEIEGRPVFPYLYPPVTLLAFLPFASRSYAAITVPWMGLELLVLAALIAGWWRWLRPRVPLSILTLVALFGWNATTQASLAAGNVALVECGLVWAAFASFAAEKRGAFAVLVVVAACFKLAPAALLLLLCVPTPRHAGRVRAFLVAALAVTALVGLPMVIGPAARFAPFWTQASGHAEAGLANPGGIGFFTALARGCGVAGPRAVPIGAGAWLLATAALVALGGPVLQDAWRGRDPVRWTMIAAFLLVLLQPRPMAYGYVVLTPAPLVLAPRPFRDRAGRLALALVLAAQGLLRLTRNEGTSPFFVHAPWLLTVCVWLLVVNEVREDARVRAEPVVEEVALARAA